ncbi:hypothetical protein CFE70_001108 [Pyrenophora teres f. teres 0-1]
MSSSSTTLLRETTQSFCRALIAPPPPSDLLAQYFSSWPQITEHGPEWSRIRLPFLAKTFAGREGCKEYFKLMTDVLEMALPDDAFPGKEGFIVDAEAGMVSVVDEPQSAMQVGRKPLASRFAQVDPSPSAPSFSETNLQLFCLVLTTRSTCFEQLRDGVAWIPHAIPRHSNERMYSPTPPN